MPTCHHFTILRITNFGVISIDNQTCISCLSRINTILSKVIIVSIDLLNACKLFAIYVVRKAAVLNSPAIVYNVSKSIGILKCCISCTKPCTGLAIECGIGIYERIESVNFLVFRLLCEGIKSICSEISLIAQVTSSNNVKTVTRLFHCAILRGKLYSLEHAKRICICGINCLSLVNPIENKSQSISLFIELHLCKREILVHDFEFAIINNYVIIEINSCRDFSQYADTFCKLEQEVPCVYIFHIRAGKHIRKIRKLCRNRDLRHINSEDIGCFHLSVHIDSRIGHVVSGSGIADFTEPCKLTVTACCHAEIKCIFTLLIHIKSDLAVYRLITCKANCNLNNLCTSRFITNKYIAGNGTVLVIFKRKLEIVTVNCHRLIIIACSYGKYCICAVNSVHMRLGKVDVLGNHDIHLSSADDFTVKHHINLNRTVSLTGKYAICSNRCKALIGNCPCITLRKLNFVTCRANALTGHLNGSSNS